MADHYYIHINAMFSLWCVSVREPIFNLNAYKVTKERAVEIVATF